MGEFQERHPLIVAPIYTDLPFEPGKDLTVSEVAHIARGMRIAIAVTPWAFPPWHFRWASGTVSHRRSR